MNNLAQGDNLTPIHCAATAHAAFALYATAYPGAEISDLITNLAHLADQETDQGGDATLRHAAARYGTELPKTEYRFHTSDLGNATAALLGDGWTATPHRWGTGSAISGPYVTSFTLLVNDDNDLCIAFDQYDADALPETPELPTGVDVYDNGVYLTEASAADAPGDLAARVATAIRAITGTNGEQA